MGRKNMGSGPCKHYCVTATRHRHQNTQTVSHIQSTRANWCSTMISCQAGLQHATWLRNKLPNHELAPKQRAVPSHTALRCILAPRLAAECGSHPAKMPGQPVKLGTLEDREVVCHPCLPGLTQDRSPCAGTQPGWLPRWKACGLPQWWGWQDPALLPTAPFA